MDHLCSREVRIFIVGLLLAPLTTLTISILRSTLSAGGSTVAPPDVSSSGRGSSLAETCRLRRRLRPTLTSNSFPSRIGMVASRVAAKANTSSSFCRLPSESSRFPMSERAIRGWGGLAAPVPAPAEHRKYQ